MEVDLSKEITLGNLFHLRLSARRSAWVAFLLVWAALAIVALVWLKAAPGAALAGALAAAVLHWLSELAHQLGHAWAARRSGYPMSGIRFWGPLSTCLYPDEPELPARVHIRRALGGPLASLCLSILAGLLALWVYPVGGLQFYILVFFFLDNFFVLTLGAFLPLGFTDGSTLLNNLGKR
jgi:hypothetical protein